MLYDQGYKEQDIIELHAFLDWMMRLPEELEREFQNELKAFEEAKQMKYVTTIERMAADEKARNIALNMLKDNLSVEQVARFTGLTIVRIQQLQSEME